LYDFQQFIVTDIEAKIAAGPCRSIVCCPTGSGKTVIAAELIRRLVAHGLRVLFLVHRRELTRQSLAKLFNFAVDAGIIQAGFPERPAARIQIASISTLYHRTIASRSREMPPADLLIVDEAHHARARTWNRIIDNYPDATVIGLTATPARHDGKGLGNIFNEILQPVSVADLTPKYLVPAVTYAPTQPDLKGVRVARGDYVESELAERMITGRLMGDIVEHVHKIGVGRRTVVFAVDVRHSVHLRDELRRSGLRAEHIDGTTPLEERDLILAELGDGFVDVVCNCAVLTEGWDRPEVSRIVLARPTRSLVLYRQMIGRGLRLSPGKTDCIILDHAGAVFQHGFIDDPIPWTLDEDKCVENKAHSARGQHEAPKLTTCPECHAVRFEGKPCPVCGWRPVAKPRHVEIEDGQLGEVKRDGNVEAPVLDELGFYRELKGALAEKRRQKPGTKDGWVFMKFVERTGKKPPWAWHSAEPLPPSPAVRAWVKSRDIAFAKAAEARR
jgi:superfamily II DNA or RNA helicase